MIKITLKDGSTKEYPKGISVISIAKDISEGLARNVISASFNGRTLENSSEITENGKIEFYTWDNDEGKKAFWHSSSHVMAQAISELFPGIKLTIGPAITNGFYYDIDLEDHKISESDFSNIENRILEICREKHDFKIRSSSKKNAVEFYKNEKNPYKLELINDLKDGEITFCDHSNFTDLCKGGHIPNTSLIKAVKILNISGAFWRADQNNKQLTRVYGISFPKQKLLKEYLQNIEQAKLRDHRKIGKNLKLFSFSNKVGLGLPLWLPKGVDLRYRLENFLRKAQKKAGYQVINIEDLGEGAHHADIVINALYSEINGLKNQYVGPAYTILRDEFKKATESIEYEKNDQVIISFGGVDPNKISETIYHELSKTDIPFYIIEPPFRKLNIVSEQILKKPIEIINGIGKFICRILPTCLQENIFGLSYDLYMIIAAIITFLVKQPPSLGDAFAFLRKP